MGNGNEAGHPDETGVRPLLYTSAGLKALKRNLPSGPSLRQVPAATANDPADKCNPLGFPLGELQQYAPRTGTTAAPIKQPRHSYSAPSLNPGTYTVRAEAKGFQAIERQNITIAVGQDVRVDLSLQPGEQTQTITVTESIPLIQTTNAQLTDTLENRTINELPLNGREFTKLLAYRPGTKSNGLDIYVNGNGASSNSWMFDGLEDFNEWSASGPIVGGQNMFDEATILPIDTIQEVNVVDVPKAEYGWKPGAEVNVGLKSGTNSIHGTANAFGRDTAMDAKNQFLGVLPKAVDNLEQFGATIGGPILKNKLFYYAGYEGQRYGVGSPRFAKIPTSAPGAGAANSFPDAIAELNSKGVPLSQLGGMHGGWGV